LCGSNLVYAITAADNCGVASTNQLAGLPSGSSFPVGVTTNTFRVTDAAGNTNTCSCTVTVLDPQPPFITCPPDIITNLPSGGEGVTNLALGTPVSGDNCGVASVSNNAPALFPAGTNLVRWTVTDGERQHQFLPAARDREGLLRGFERHAAARHQIPVPTSRCFS